MSPAQYCLLFTMSVIEDDLKKDIYLMPVTLVRLKPEPNFAEYIESIWNKYIKCLLAKALSRNCSEEKEKYNRRNLNEQRETNTRTICTITVELHIPLSMFHIVSSYTQVWHTTPECKTPCEQKVKSAREEQNLD